MPINATNIDENIETTDKRTTIVRLFKYLLKYKIKIVLVLLIMLFIVAISLLNPLIMERAIDVHIANKDMNSLLKLGFFAILINLIFVVLVKLRMYIMSEISNKVLLNIRQELYTHIQTLSFSFFDGRPTGKILARIIGDVNSLKNVLSNSVTTLIPDFITISAVLTIMLVKNWRLALASLVALPILMIGLFLIQTFSHKRWQLHRKKSSNLNASLHEDLSGMRIIQSFNAESEINDEFNILLKEHRGSFVKAVLLNDAFGSLIDISWAIGSILMFIVAIKIIGIKADNVGTLLAFASYNSMFWRPIMNLSNFYNQIITNLSAAERIFDILDTEAEIVDSNNVFELPPIKGEVIFEDVSFSYNKDTPVLKNVSFNIKPGESIALVGPTGAGKTTIVNLISRFYEIQEGNIYIDGYNIKDVSIESLRKQMGIMTQDNFLFSGTIKDNIRYGKLDATDEEIIDAAKAVNAHDFITNLDKGYDTELKERGSGLSIGQKQLLAFARTMVSMPKILILDEATSSIDTHTELLVQEGISTLLKDRTSFVIAHRLSTISSADRIFVIDDGKILEEGTSKELLEKKALYYDLYVSQFKFL
ncbi:MAG TPA: ABC transporter ATP-binding protein [Clostridiales bacterium]|nr:ABC transporter ATP-binding protein [Clostridiales bacterium]